MIRTVDTLSSLENDLDRNILGTDSHCTLVVAVIVGQNERRRFILDS